MKIHKYKENGNIQIYNLADVHRGNPNCDSKLFNKTIEHIKNEKTARWISTGDILEVALKNSKSDVYSAMNPEEEFETIIRELSPIADKCYGIVESNHHARFYKETGMSLDKRVCEGLGIKDKFLGAIGLICVITENSSFYIAMHHGVGGGRLRGSKATSLNRFSDVISGADIYMEGHTHSYDHFIDEINYIDRKRVINRNFESHFVCTGHYLKWDKSYAQNLKLKPMPLGCSRVELIPHNSGRHELKKIKVDLFN